MKSDRRLFALAKSRGMAIMTENNKGQVHHSRRSFLSAALAAPVLASFSLETQWTNVSRISYGSSPVVSAKNVRVVSPDRHLEFQLFNDQSRLQFRITLGKTPVVETSRLGMRIDEVDLSQNVEIGRVQNYRTNEKYASRGVHSEATDHSNGAKISLRHPASNTNYTLEVRAYDDGVAFRHIVPGNDKGRVPDEATVFTLPEGCSVWFHDFEGHYEGFHTRKEIAEVRAGEWAAP